MRSIVVRVARPRPWPWGGGNGTRTRSLQALKRALRILLFEPTRAGALLTAVAFAKRASPVLDGMGGCRAVHVASVSSLRVLSGEFATWQSSRLPTRMRASDPCQPEIRGAAISASSADQQRCCQKSSGAPCKEQKRLARHQVSTLGEIDERVADGDVADSGKICGKQPVLRDLK